MKKVITIILLLLAAPLIAAAQGWSPQLAQAAVNLINGFSGSFTLGSGLSVNTHFFDPTSVPATPWAPFPNNNVLLQATGPQNVLRNATFTSWAHTKFMTQDNPGSNPYVIGIASFTATIDNGSGSAGTTLTASSVTGTIQPFQRVTDGLVLQTTQASAVSATTLTVASTTGINAGMYVTDVDSPRAIAGNITVSSVSGGNTVHLSGPVGFTSNIQIIGAPGVGSGDHISFGTVKRGTYIVQQLGGTPGGAGTYQTSAQITSPAQLVASESMVSEGGWSAEGVYVIARGTAGSSSVTCSGPIEQGNFAPTAPQCDVSGTLTDLIFRFPIDWVDASRINCPLYAGVLLECVTSNILIQPITFHIMMTYSESISSAPSIISKISCPLIAPNVAGANVCLDDWTNATTDLITGSLPTCFLSTSPVTCDYAYTWVPTGIQGDMEIEFHTGPLANGQYVILDGMELKQTPSATCAGAAPPCSQTAVGFQGPMEIPEVVSDIAHNARFAQLIGTGWEDAINPFSKGAIETTMGFAYDTTHFYASWPLPVTMRCDMWFVTAKEPPTCPAPNVYFMTPAAGDYTFNNAGGQASATALTLGKLGLNTIQIIGTTTGLTANQPGFVTFGGGTTVGFMTLIDSAIIGD